MEEVKYAKDYLEEVTETKWNPAQQIGLIPFCCGIGKTTAAREGHITKFVSRITGQEIQKKETLLLTFRKMAKEQQLAKKGFVEAFSSEAFNFSNDCVAIGTAHAIGYAWCNPQEEHNEFVDYWIRKHPRLLILDEIHCLMEGNFAESLNGVFEYIEDCVKDQTCFVVALDGTTDFISNYLFNKEYSKTNIELCEILEEEPRPIYAPKQINVISHSSLDSVIPWKEGEIREDRKAFVVCHSAEKAYQLTQERNKKYEDACFICSKNSKSLVRVGEDKLEEAGKLLDLACFESIVRESKYPEGVNVVFATIAAREAIELKDERIRYVALDLYDEIGVIQSMNRVRHSIEELDVIADGRGIIQGLDEQRRCLEDLASLPDEPSQEDLARYHHNWLETVSLYKLHEIAEEEVYSPIVYKVKGCYRVNRLTLARAAYVTNSANEAFTDVNMGFEDYYRWILRNYDSKTIRFQDGSSIRNKVSHRNSNARAANEMNLDKLEPFLNLEISLENKEIVQELKKALGLKNRMYQLRPLSFYLKDEGKQSLSTLGLELRKYQVKRKTYYMLCKKV